MIVDSLRFTRALFLKPLIQQRAVPQSEPALWEHLLNICYSFRLSNALYETHASPSGYTTVGQQPGTQIQKKIPDQNLTSNRRLLAAKYYPLYRLSARSACLDEDLRKRGRKKMKQAPPHTTKDYTPLTVAIFKYHSNITRESRWVGIQIHHLQRPHL